MTEQNQFFLGASELGANLMVVGTTGKGKSVLLMQEAQRRGISYEQLLKEMEPTVEELEREKLYREEQENMRAKRLEAVRIAYWEATPAEDTELYSLSDTLTSLLPELNDTTHEQQKILFMMLPDTIVGEVIKWGIDDSVVRDDIYVYVQEHINEVRTALGRIGE